LQTRTHAPLDDEGDFTAFDILFDPARQFARLAVRPRFTVPILVLTFGTLALAIAYYSRLDYGWFAQHLIASNPIVARAAHGADLHLTKETLMWPAVFAAASSIPVQWLLQSLYVLFVAAALRRPLALSQALALTAWAGIPYIVAMLPSAINLGLHGDGRMPPEQLDPTTFEAMFGSPDEALLRGLAARVGLASLWAWMLFAIGLRVTLSLRWRVAITLVAVPTMLVLGGSAALAVIAG